MIFTSQTIQVTKFQGKVKCGGREVGSTSLHVL
jgi:hypothetical protein